jgi:hypothetical protein
MSIEPEKKPSLILILVAAFLTAFGILKLLVPGSEAEAPLLVILRLSFTGLGVVFLVVTFLRRNK